MKRPELGTWHTITENAYKDQSVKNVTTWNSEPIKITDARCGKVVADTEEYISKMGVNYHPWSDNTHWEAAPPITSYHAMYTGYRFKFEGFWEGDIYDESSHFVQTKTVEVWLFVTHENRNPIAVLPFEYAKDES